MSQSASLNIPYPTLLAFYAKMAVTAPQETFIITLQGDSSSVSSGSSVFGVISLVLFILMGVFILICVAAIIRVCIRRRRLINQVHINRGGNRDRGDDGHSSIDDAQQ